MKKLIYKEIKQMSPTVGEKNALDLDNQLSGSIISVATVKLDRNLPDNRVQKRLSLTSIKSMTEDEES